MKGSRRRFSREFKVEAVRQVLESGRPLAQVARELDISASVLRRWKQQVGADPSEAFPGNGRMKAEDEELRRLRREVVRLRQERDFLKKTAVDSAGRCNTLYYFTDLEGVVHGTVRTSWPFCDPESGVVATLEKGRVAE